VQLPPDTDLTSVRRKLACDLYYVRHADPWLDLRLLLSTVVGMLGIPFSVSRALLQIPSGEAIEEPYRLLVELGATAQVQPA